MSRYHSYLNSAIEILFDYKGEEPFSSFIKKYFAQHRKFGSSDRKQIAQLCYCYFRLGKSLPDLTTEERIPVALFLCSTGPNEFLQNLKPDWDNEASASIREKLLIINYSLLINDIFPWEDELSNRIEHEKFCGSFFVQPELFLRLRPGKEKLVKEKLTAAGIDFKIVSNACIALDNATKIGSVIDLDSEAVIQDYNSQRTGEFIKSEILNLKSKISLWDCCAGSGGKSIMLYDINPKIELTVSDVRKSILVNLEKRFQKAGIRDYKSYITDLASNQKPTTSNYDLILADVPCTGSGTWSRTPEQLYFFEKEKINEYAALQKKILSNVIHHLIPGGFLLYITCSVFKKENEENVGFSQNEFQLELIKQEILEGYDKKADTMFAALLKMPL